MDKGVVGRERKSSERDAYSPPVELQASFNGCDFGPATFRPRRDRLDLICAPLQPPRPQPPLARHGLGCSPDSRYLHDFSLTQV